MLKVVLDTSILIDYIRTNKGVFLQLLGEAKSNRIKLYTPSVVLVELWAGQNMIDKDLELYVKKLISIVEVLELSKQLAIHAGELARTCPEVGYIDMIIAVTALHLDAKLATLNIKHFKSVPGLVLFDLHSV